MREALEAFAVEKAIENLTSDAADHLRDKINLYGQDVQNRFSREHLVFDQEVHLAVAQIAGNETLKNLLNHLFERIVLKRRTDGLYDPSRGTAAHQEHLQLLAAIERRDTAEAVTLVRSHIQAGERNVMTDLKQRQAIRDFRPVELTNLQQKNIKERENYGSRSSY